MIVIKINLNVKLIINYSMKKILYAVMLLLGLSIPAISCYGQSQLPNWVIGKWECDKNEVIELTPTGFIFTVNGKVVDEGSIDVSNNFEPSSQETESSLTMQFDPPCWTRWNQTGRN